MKTKTHISCSAPLLVLHGYYNPSTLYIRNFEPQASSVTAQPGLLSDQVRNPEDRFSHNKTHVGPVYVDGVSADMPFYHEVTIEDDNIFFDTAKYLQTILSSTGQGMLLKYEPILSLSQSSECPLQC